MSETPFVENCHLFHTKLWLSKLFHRGYLSCTKRRDHTWKIWALLTKFPTESFWKQPGLRCQTRFQKACFRNNSWTIAKHSCVYVHYLNNDSYLKHFEILSFDSHMHAFFSDMPPALFQKYCYHIIKFSLMISWIIVTKENKNERESIYYVKSRSVLAQSRKGKF